MKDVNIERYYSIIRMMGREVFYNMSEEEILNEATRVFSQVRDVPYVLGAHGDPSSLFSANKGHCTNKHLYLFPRLQALGYRVELGVAQFNWRDLKVIPEEIIAILHDPIDKHLFLYASRENNEMVVDASWDPGMPEGFPVNSWDGNNQTIIGVPALSIQRFSYHILMARMTMGNVLRGFRTGTPKPTPFNDAFNAWLGRESH